MAHILAGSWIKELKALSSCGMLWIMSRTFLTLGRSETAAVQISLQGKYFETLYRMASTTSDHFPLIDPSIFNVSRNF
jgi:hypothetical protein